MYFKINTQDFLDFQLKVISTIVEESDTYVNSLRNNIYNLSTSPNLAKGIILELLHSLIFTIYTVQFISQVMRL